MSGKIFELILDLPMTQAPAKFADKPRLEIVARRASQSTTCAWVATIAMLKR